MLTQEASYHASFQQYFPKRRRYAKVLRCAQDDRLLFQHYHFNLLSRLTSVVWKLR
jgi:hypothetical protein